VSDVIPRNEWTEHMRSLLGKRVEVIIDRDKPVTVIGVLHGFTEDGEVCVRDDDLTFRWAWPNLDTRAV
jgi:hypothetical protein